MLFISLHWTLNLTLSVYLATDPEVLGSIPGASRFSEKQWVWNGVPSASWGQLRSYLEEILVAPVKKTDTNDRGDPLCWPRNTLYPQKLALLLQQAAVARSAQFADQSRGGFFLYIFSLLTILLVAQCIERHSVTQ
jgi:hypothetical protein